MRHPTSTWSSCYCPDIYQASTSEPTMTGSKDFKSGKGLFCGVMPIIFGNSPW
jgi:hypothetical protein